jgi:hypothetical protein
MIGSSHGGEVNGGIIGAKGVCDSDGLFTSPIVAVCASPVIGGKFVGLSCMGEIAEYTVSEDTLEKLATHRYGKIG